MPARIDTLLQQGLTAHRRGAFVDAVRHYRQVLDTEPAQPDALYYLASAYCGHGEFNRGLEAAQRAVAANPQDARCHNLVGRALSCLGRNEEAVAAFAEAIRLKADFAEAYGNRGNALSELGRLPDAIADYNCALDLRPDNVEDLCNCGAAFDRLGRHQEALDCFDRALTLVPDLAPAHFNRATVLMSLGRHREALAAFDRNLAITPGSVEAWNNRGNVLKRLGRDAEALASFERALSIRPDDANALNNRGTTLNKLGRHDEAVAVFVPLVGRDPHNMGTRFNLANALAASKRHEEALAQYQDVIARSPGHVDAYMGAGAALQALQRYTEALKTYERVLAFSPALAEAHDNVGVVLYELGRYGEALAHARKAVELKPDLVSAQYNLATTLQTIEQYDEALTHFDRTLALEPGHAKASWNKGLLYLNTGHIAEGWSFFERRFDASISTSLRRHPSVTEWDGDKLDGTLLVWGEAGLGDQILAASMAAELSGKATSIVLQPEPRLVKLFSRSFPGIQISAEPPPRFDAHVACGSLGRHLRQDWGAFPTREQGYLLPDRALVQRLRARVTAGGGAAVGLSWRSVNPILGREKSASLADFGPVLQLPGLRFVDLQYGDTGEERDVIAGALGIRIEHLEDVDNTNDLDSLAALAAACDLVLTVSNTTAHLAGAVGAQTLVFVPTGPARLWYWFRGHERSPWYPHVHVRHQALGQSWRDLITRSTDQVQQLLA